MTRHDVDSLLRDWDEVSRTARTPDPAVRTGRVRTRGNGPATLPLLVVAIAVVAGIAVFARPAGGPGGGATPGVSTAAIAPVTDSVDDGTLRLTLTADRGTYAEGDVIAAAATVEYIGTNAAIEVFTALDRIIFGVAEVGGGRQAGGGARQSCNPNTFERALPVSYPWAKNAAYVPGDPAFAFEEWYATSGPQLRLPAGMWRLSATFEGAEGDCGAASHTLVAEVAVTVLPGIAASGTPAPPVAVTPVPTAPSAGPSNVVTCGRFEPFVCGGVLMALAADHADELSVASRIVIDDVCPPDAICDRQYPFAALVVVVPPEGIEAAIVYLVTGKDGPEEVAASTEPISRHMAAQAAGPGAAPEPIPLRTGDPPDGIVRECPAALLEGRLVADPASGLAIQAVDAPDAPIVTVVWPFGYTARVDTVGYALVDERGATIAHAGDLVGIGGGEPEDGTWGACGGVTLMRRGE